MSTSGSLPSLGQDMILMFEYLLKIENNLITFLIFCLSRNSADKSKVWVRELNATVETISSDSLDGVAAVVESSSARSSCWAGEVQRIANELNGCREELGSSVSLPSSVLRKVMLLLT